MKLHTPTEWAKFFGIEIIDWDGWRSKGLLHDIDKAISLDEFNRRVSESTILPVDAEKYKMLDFLCR